MAVFDSLRHFVAGLNDEVEAELAIGILLQPIAEADFVAQKDARSLGDGLADDGLLLLAARARLQHRRAQAAVLQHHAGQGADQPAADDDYIRVHCCRSSSAKRVAIFADRVTIGNPAPGCTVPPARYSPVIPANLLGG